jgi:anti-sigma factor RsiW
VNIPTFLGRRVVVDDGMPAASNIYETWLFGSGALRLGAGAPKVPTETDRLPSAGNGGGQEVLYDRVEWAIHPVGHAYVGTAPNGGPDNTATANNLAAAASWSRRFPERKQIKIARLITREA